MRREDQARRGLPAGNLVRVIDSPVSALARSMNSLLLAAMRQAYQAFRSLADGLDAQLDVK